MGLRVTAQQLASREAKETPVSSKMSGNKDEECKVVGGPLGWFSSGTWGLKAEGGSWGNLSANMWGPVAVDYHERCLSLPFIDISC